MTFYDIKNSISWFQKIIFDITNSNSCYQKYDIFWHQKFDFLISKIIFWYQEMELLILIILFYIYQKYLKKILKRCLIVKCIGIFQVIRFWSKFWSVEIDAFFVFLCSWYSILTLSYLDFFRDAYANILFACTYRVKIA